MAQVTSEVAPGAPVQPDQARLDGSQQVTGRSPWELFWRRFRRDKFAMGSLILLVLLTLLAILAGFISRNIVGHGPNDLYLREMTDSFGLPKGPNGQFWFGADLAGRDLFVRVLYGARTSLTVAYAATAIAVVIGVPAGIMAGYYRGKVDTVVSRTIDIVLSLPILLISLGLVSACGLRASGCLGGLIKPGLTLVSLVIGLFSWPYIA